MANEKKQENTFYRYALTSFQILFNGEEPISINPAEIKSLSIEKDFDEDLYSILHVNVILKPTIYYKILKNKSTVKFRVRFDTYKYDKDKPENKIKKTIFNEIFSIFLDESTPFFNEENYKKAEDAQNGQMMTDFANSFDLFLFKDADVSAASNVINYVISSSNMQTVVAFLLSRVGVRKVLMAPFNNTSSYNEIILPPLKLISELSYLEKMYGFYTDGSMIFFDFDCLYFINKSSACKAFRTNEYKQVVINIKKMSNNDAFTPGNYVDSENKKYYLNIPRDNVKLHTDTLIENQVNGSTLSILDTERNSISTLDTASEVRGSSTKNVIINNYGNSYTNTDLQARKKENATIVSAMASDFDINIITPNKEFMFIYENTEYNKKFGGKHRISKAVFTFDKLANDEFSVKGTFIFKKY